MVSKSIKISTEAAKIIGLEEATLLSILEHFNKEILYENVLSQCSFWKENQLIKTLNSLKNKGLVQYKEDFSCIKLINISNHKIIEPNTSFDAASAQPIEENWEPETKLIEQASDYGIPAGFVLNQLQEFKYYWLEKKEAHRSWELKFLRHVIKAWRKEEVLKNQERKKYSMHDNWIPDQEALDILVKSGVNISFIEGLISEFILYWIEKGEVSDTWNSKFIAYIRRQWARSQNLIENENKPKIIPSNWKPNTEFYDVLSLSNIEKEFANNLIPEFILYWKEEGKAYNSWNSKFFQHVKYNWNNKFKSPNLAQDIEKRIGATWEIEMTEETSKHSVTKKETPKTIKSKLDQLREQHKI